MNLDIVLLQILALSGLGPEDHVVYIDNLFTSIPLVDKLYQTGINRAWTTRAHLKGYPTCLKDPALMKKMKKKKGGGVSFTQLIPVDH